MFRLSFTTDNDAFRKREAGASAALLRVVALKLEEGTLAGTIRDENGNTIGSFMLNDPRALPAIEVRRDATFKLRKRLGRPKKGG